MTGRTAKAEKHPAKAKGAQNVISGDKETQNVGSLFWRTFSGDGFLLLMGAGHQYCTTFMASMEFFLPSPGNVLLGAFPKVGARFFRLSLSLNQSCRRCTWTAVQVGANRRSALLPLVSGGRPVSGIKGLFSWHYFQRDWWLYSSARRCVHMNLVTNHDITLGTLCWINHSMCRWSQPHSNWKNQNCFPRSHSCRSTASSRVYKYLQITGLGSLYRLRIDAMVKRDIR